MCSKQVRGYFLVYSGLISIVRLMFVILKKMYSKQTTSCFLVYHATFFNTKNACSKQGKGRFLVYLFNFAIRKHVCSNQAGTAFVIQKMYVQNKWEAAF